MSFLIIQTAFLGDLVLTTSLINALRVLHPGCHITVVAVPRAAPVLAGLPGVEVIAYDKSKTRLLPGLWALRQKFGGRRFDKVFCAHRSLRSRLIAGMANAKEKRRFGKKYPYPPYSDDIHYVDKVMALLPEWKGPRPLPILAVTETERLEAHGLLPEALRGKPYVVVSPFSVWGTKEWPLERFEALAQRLSDEKGFTVVWVGVPRNSKTRPQIAPGAVDLTGKTSLGALKALIAEAQLVVTNDSAPVHIAAAFERPTLAFFGPTVRKWGFFPLSPTMAVVEIQGLDCRPCSLHGPMRCPLKHFRCMTEISVEGAWAASQRIL
jgi:heptosyltransferase-2